MENEQVKKNDEKSLEIKIIAKPYTLSPRKNYVGEPTCKGDKFKIKAKLSIDSVTGSKIAEAGDKFDLDAEIQSYAASTDIVSIITRLQNGDESVINVRNDGVNGDLSIFPKDINDVTKFKDLNESARESFNGLSDDIKAIFNNDPAIFFNAVLNNQVDAMFAAYQTKIKELKDKDKPIEDGTDKGGAE